jgi:hypothetical protein
LKVLSIVLFILAGATGLLAVGNIRKELDPGIAQYLGTFIIPVLLGWWGKIALDRANAAASQHPVPTPDTHVRCPDCKELVLKEAKVCKHCQARLLAADA